MGSVTSRRLCPKTLAQGARRGNTYEGNTAKGTGSAGAACHQGVSTELFSLPRLACGLAILSVSFACPEPAQEAKPRLCPTDGTSL